MTKFSNFLRKYANGWLILGLLAIWILFNAMILPQQQKKMEAGSGGTGPIDLLVVYTPEKVYGMIAAYSPDVRSAYRTFELTGDVAYPIIYTFLFALAISWCFKRGYAPDSRMQQYNVIPFGAWLLDLFENLGIVAMLSVFPATPGILAWFTAVFTFLKWMFVFASAILLVVGFVKAAMNKFKIQE